MEKIINLRMSESDFLENLYVFLFSSDFFKTKTPEKFADILEEYYNYNCYFTSPIKLEDYFKTRFNEVMKEDFDEREIEEEICYFLYCLELYFL